MIMKEETKLRMIWKIDTISIAAKYHKRQLNDLRKKYIYKDVSYSELVQDVKWLDTLLS